MLTGIQATRYVLLVLAILTCQFLGTSMAADPPQMESHTIDGGGGTATGGGFELSGAIGQPDAGRMTGGSFELAGGFWHAFAPGDCDGSNTVDLDDFATFEECFSGPAGGVHEGCECYDLDNNGWIDLADFVLFASNFTGT